MHGPLDEHKNITTCNSLHGPLDAIRQKHNNYNSCACLHGPLDEHKNITTIIHVHVYMGH